MQLEGRVPSELWRIDGEGRGVELYGGVEFPNGVGFAPGGRTLYHSNYSAGAVLAHDLADDGSAVGRRVFAHVPRGHPDGLAVEGAGGGWRSATAVPSRASRPTARSSGPSTCRRPS